MDIIDIERALLKRYRAKLYTPFIKALKTYEMIKENDRIAVCVSGGKDSLLLAKLFQILHKYSDFPFEVKYFAMDPGFTKENRKRLEDNCKLIDIPIIIKDSDIFKVAKKLNEDSPCYMCARMRRGFLYRIAQEESCNKIALAHHFDDVIETILLNIFYGGKYKTMMPKLKSKNYENMELIRPLVFVKEKDIVLYANYIGLDIMNCGCEIASKSEIGKRNEIKEFIKILSKYSKNIPMNIFRSAENVNLNACIKWKEREKFTHFLENYNNSYNEED